MLKKFYVSLAFILFAISLFLGADRFFHHQSTRFSINKMTTVLANPFKWELPPLSSQEKSELSHILNQKFTYYNKGSQSYVFISEDKKYILKFFKQQKFTSRSWLAHIPLSFNPYYQEYLFKQNKCRSALEAFKTAFTELSQETGLLYVHMSPSQSFHQRVMLLDKNSEGHSVDLGKMVFCVQKHADLIYSRIIELMHQGDVEGAKKIISSVFSLIDHLGKKGVVDNDPILRKNFGLIEDVAVQIDIGKLRIDPSRGKNLLYKQEIGSITHSFKVWIETYYPELSSHFEQCLRAAIS